MLTSARLLLAAVVLSLIAGAAPAGAITIEVAGGNMTDPWLLVPMPDNGVVYFDRDSNFVRVGPDLTLSPTDLSAHNGFGYGSDPSAASDAAGVIWGAGSSTATPIARLGPAPFNTLSYSGPIALSAGPHVVPKVVTFGPDGNLWFTELDYPSVSLDVIARLNPDGTATEFGPLSAGAKPEALLAGPDGNVWFTETGTNSIGRISMSGAVTEFLLPAGMTLAGVDFRRPRTMTFGPGGDLYFTVVGGLARMTPAGNVVGGIINGGLADFAPTSVAYGGDGNLWVTECGLDTVARVSPSGAVTRAPAGTFPARACPKGMVSTPDGTPWMMEWNTGRAARVVFQSPRVTTDYATGVASTAAELNGVTTPRGAKTTTYFEYGKTAAYGKTTTAVDAGDGDEPIPVTAVLGDLEPLTTYHYRLTASSPIGTVKGADETVTTTAIPALPAPVDHDGDGYPVTVDCDDQSSAIHPGARDKPGDGVDQNCDLRDSKYPRFQPNADAGWVRAHGRTTFTRLVIDEMPAGSSLQLTCSGQGCKLRDAYRASISKAVRRLDVTSHLKRAKLGKGAKVELVLSRPGYVTTIVRWTIGPPPRVSFFCRAPGMQSAAPC